MVVINEWQREKASKQATGSYVLGKLFGKVNVGYYLLPGRIDQPKKRYGYNQERFEQRKAVPFFIFHSTNGDDREFNLSTSDRPLF